MTEIKISKQIFLEELGRYFREEGDKCQRGTDLGKYLSEMNSILSRVRLLSGTQGNVNMTNWNKKEMIITRILTSLRIGDVQD